MVHRRVHEMSDEVRASDMDLSLTLKQILPTRAREPRDVGIARAEKEYRKGRNALANVAPSCTVALSRLALKLVTIPKSLMNRKACNLEFHVSVIYTNKVIVRRAWTKVTGLTMVD